MEKPVPMPGARRTNIRWMVVGLCFLGMVVNYIDRANLGASMPSMSKELGLSSFQQGLALSAFFYAYAAFQFFGGWTGDYLVKRGFSLARARKTVICIGMLAGSTIALSVFVPSVEWAVALLCLSYSGIAFTASNSGSLCMDIAPTGRHVASIMGIQNGAANVAGIIMPVVVGYLVGETHNFSNALILIGVFGLIGAFSFIFIIGKVEPLKVDDNESLNSAAQGVAS